MNPKLESILILYDMHSEMLLEKMLVSDDYKGEKRINGKGNSIKFLVMHLLNARYFLSEYIKQPLINPFEDFFGKISSIEDIREYPRLDDLIRHWKNLSHELPSSISKLSDEFLSSRGDYDFEIENKSVLGGLTFLMHHEAYHIGQINLLIQSINNIKE